MSGSRTERLLFLPGLDGTGISFEPLRPFIRGNIETTIVRYTADRPLTFEETVDCASRRINGDFDVALAESFSGPVAMALVGSGRLETKGLVLSATFARAPRPVLMKIMPLIPIEAILKFPCPDSWLKRFMGDPKAARVILPLWRRIKTEVPARILAHRIRMVGRIDVRRYLPKITIPCIYIQATKDRIVPSSSVSDFARALPGLEIRKIDGPHPILQVEPAASAAIIHEFMDAVMGDSQPEGRESS